MTEHRPESAPPQPIGHLDAVRSVTLPAIPTVYGLAHPDESVTEWVFALPGGKAFIVSSKEKKGGIVHTSLDQVAAFWAPFHGAELVLVTS